MPTSRARLAQLLAIALVAPIPFGCESRPKADQVVPVAQVPANLMEIARKQLPGVNFDTAYKMQVDGKDAYEIKGKTKEGKTREVEVSVTGEVLEIE